MSIKIGRAIGLLSSEIESQRMTLAEALETAQLSPELELDADESEYVCERLRTDYGR